MIRQPTGKVIKTLEAYYFSIKDKTLQHGDGRHIRTGCTHKVTGSLKLCEHGLHASVRLIDALTYAPGPVLWLVELGGDILTGDDKLCASERTYIKGMDISKVLRAFARKQALINIDKVRPYCSTEDFELILNWLNTGDERLRSAACSAAYASRSAAYAAAYAARSAAAAYSAACSADATACSAAYASRSAAYAARAAAYSAACSAADEMLVEMVEEFTGWRLRQ